MRATHLLPLALAPMVTVALCAAAARAIGGDPMLGAELGVAAVVGAWLTLLARRTGPAIAGQRQLEHREIGRVAEEGVGQGRGAPVEGPRDGDSPLAVSGPPPILDRRMQAGVDDEEPHLESSDFMEVTLPSRRKSGC